MNKNRYVNSFRQSQHIANCFAVRRARLAVGPNLDPARPAFSHKPLRFIQAFNTSPRVYKGHWDKTLWITRCRILDIGVSMSIVPVIRFRKNYCSVKAAPVEVFNKILSGLTRVAIANTSWKVGGDVVVSVDAQHLSCHNRQVLPNTCRQRSTHWDGACPRPRFAAEAVPSSYSSLVHPPLLRPQAAPKRLQEESRPPCCSPVIPTLASPSTTRAPSPGCSTPCKKRAQTIRPLVLRYRATG